MIIDKVFEVKGTKLIKYTGTDDNVIIPDSITEICEKAFASIELRSISFGSNIKRIEADLMNKTFSKALNYYLNLKGKNQQDLINDLGYSSSTVSQWCNGKNIPRMDRLKALATYLGIDKTELLKDPEAFSQEKFNADPDLVSELLDRKPALYELFKLAITLSNKDLKLLTKLALRLNGLQNTEI